MRAGNRLARMVGESKRFTLSKDIVTSYAADPSPRKLAAPADARVVDTHVNLGPLIQGAAAEADHVILFSDREADGAKTVLFGAPKDNAGIVEFSASYDEGFV